YTTFSFIIFFFLSMPQPPTRSTLFPYTTLFRSRGRRRHLPSGDGAAGARAGSVARRLCPALAPADRRPLRRQPEPAAALLPAAGDRKSTRLNSSHLGNSYAVFCLKKKKKIKIKK